MEQRIENGNKIIWFKGRLEQTRSWENQRGQDAEQQNDKVWNVKNNVKDRINSIQSITSKGVIVNREYNRVDKNREAKYNEKSKE